MATVILLMGPVVLWHMPSSHNMVVMHTLMIKNTGQWNSILELICIKPPLMNLAIAWDYHIQMFAG